MTREDYEKLSIEHLGYVSEDFIKGAERMREFLLRGNSITIDGVVYEKQKELRDGSCDGCAFSSDGYRCDVPSSQRFKIRCAKEHIIYVK